MRRLQSSLAVGLCLLTLGVSCAHPKPKPVILPPSPRPIVTKPKPVTEIRAVWVSDTAKLDWDKATRDLQRAGFNTMYVNLVSAGAALYPHSQSLPSVVDSGTDEVARGIELAHRRGIAVHAKFIVMFSFKSPSEYQRRLLKADRVMRGEDGKLIMQSGCYWVCPSQTVNRDTMKAAITETLTRYPVDGIQFDYIRFNEEPSCYCKTCRQAAAKFPGAFNDWRLQLMNDWARDLSATARRARPGVKVSAAVFPLLGRAREEKAQDWKLWVDRGYLDYICTMNYTPDTREFESRNRSAIAAVPRERVVAGIGSWKLNDPAALRDQIDSVRRAGDAGFALFSYDDAETRSFLPDLNPR